MSILCETCDADATHRNLDGSFTCFEHAEDGAESLNPPASVVRILPNPFSETGIRRRSEYGQLS